MRFIQVLVALGALLLEVEMFRNATKLYRGDRKKVHLEILLQYPKPFLLYLVLSSLGYIIFSVVWMFSSTELIQHAGMILVILGLISLGITRSARLTKIWNHPIIFRINAFISSACLIAVIWGLSNV